MMNFDADDPSANHYNDGNRAFLQAVMARGTINLEEGKAILAAIFTAQDNGRETLAENVTEADLLSYLAAASKALSPFDYEIRNMVHQVSKERIYALINSTSDPLTQLATTRSAEEIAFVKRLLDAMFETYNTQRKEIMGVTSLEALNLCELGSKRNRPSGTKASNVNPDDDEDAQPATQAAEKGLNKMQAQHLLGSLVAEGWLERSSDGWYTLSTRALLELKSWLTATYNDDERNDAEEAHPDKWRRIRPCVACKSIVTIGQRCPDLECNIRLHNTCYDAYWGSRAKTCPCPRCDTEWDEEHWVGEKAVTTKEAWLKGKRRSMKNRRQEVVVD